MTESIPDKLLGDAVRLKEVIVSLMADALHRSSQGSVKLSVFGKVLGEAAHLLVSIRFVPENEMPSGKLPERDTGPAFPGLDLEIAGNLLAFMDSGLKSVPSSDTWQEVYFEMDQRIADPAPVGRIAMEDMDQ